MPTIDQFSFKDISSPSKKTTLLDEDEDDKLNATQPTESTDPHFINGTPEGTRRAYSS